VRHLGAIVEISALTVLDARQDHALCGSVALELVRHDARGTYRKPFSGLRKNRLAAVALRRNGSSVAPIQRRQQSRQLAKR
jgi:hypothetical protein